MTKNNLTKCLAWFLQYTEPDLCLNHVVAVSDIADDPATDIGIENEPMARLQLAPRSASKPRLLAQITQTKNNTLPPTPAPSRSPLKQSATSYQVPNDTPQLLNQNKSIITRTPVKFEDIFDIDDLEDLIDEDTNDVSASSYGEFGSPEVLWDEQSASRVEPPAHSRGRKRKSEEYLADSESPKLTKQITSNGRVDQDSYKRNAKLPELLETSSSEENDQAGIWEPTITDVNVVRSPPRSHDDYSDSQSTIRPIARRIHSGADISTARRMSEARSSNSPPPTTSVNTRGYSAASFSKKARAGAVLDTDEENEHTDSFNTKLRRRPSGKGGTEIPVPIKITESPVKELPRDMSRPGHPPQQNDTPMNGRSLRLQNTTSSLSSSQNTGSSDPFKTKLSESERQMIMTFMNVPTGQCDKLLKRLEISRRETSAKMAEQLYEDEEVSPETKQQMKEIKSKMAALQEISKLRDDYEQLSTRRDELKRKLLEVVDQQNEYGDGTTHGSEYSIVMSEIRDLKPQIDAVEVSLHGLIIQAGWSHGQEYVPVDEPDKALSRENAVRSRNVLVASTQHVKVSPNPPRRQNSPPAPHKFQEELSIAHTPVPRRDEDNGYYPPSSRRTPQHVWDQNSYKAHAASIERNHSGAGVDEFDDAFDDEEDMVDAAQALEHTLNSHGAIDVRNKVTRPVMSELSDNIRRPPSSTSNVTKAAPTQQHTWSKDVSSAMRKRFHLEGFRHNQLEAINATLSGKDAFVLMPTGGGKSLCYQLPSIIQSGRTHGVTIVISPLLSLMQDQVDHLQKLQIQAFMINGESTREHKNYIYQALQDSQPERFVQLLYVTPELLAKSTVMTNKFASLHRNKKLARIVIDEAHCVSQWGHDFRPDYKALGDIRAQLSGVPVMALTATATENVKVDVIHNLKMAGCEIFTQSFNRPNLSYEVRQKGKAIAALEEIGSLIQTQHKGQSGIIYCLSRKNCETVAQKLQKDFSISATHYHAGMESEARMDVQKRWQAGRYKVIVATIAFGMGIDKADVRFVIHHTIPKSLEGYYQETGRAGRDGRESSCYLFYGYGDTSSIKRMIDDSKDSSWQQKERQKQMLRNVVQFCENKSDCRRVQVLAYFNEHFERADCNDTCDNCRSDSIFVTEDFSHHAENIINLVQQVEDSGVTLLHCVDVYRGAKGKKFVELDHDQLNEYGLGSVLDRGDIERCFYRLLSEDALEEEQRTNRGGFTNAYIKLGRNAEAFRNKSRSFTMQVRVSPRGKAKANVGGKKSRAATRDIDESYGADYPASTNVSSPIEARKSNKKKSVRRIPAQVIHEDSEESDNGFAPVLERGRSLKSRKPSVGPPITIDHRSGQLSDAHKSVLDLFIDEARRKVQEIGLNKGLRQRPISDTMLREIGITFPRNEDDLRKVAGMTEEKLKLFGSSLLRMIRASHANYLAMTACIDDQPHGDTRSRTVLEISDDEDVDLPNLPTEENFIVTDDDDDFEPEQLEDSRYFRAATDESFSRPAPAMPGSRKPNITKKVSSQSRSSGSAFYRRGSTYGRGRGGKTSTTRVTKRKSNTSSRASSNVTKRASGSESKRGGKSHAGSKSTQASLIGMMPT